MNFCVYEVVMVNRLKQGLEPHSYIGSKSNFRFEDGKLFNINGKEYLTSSQSKLFKQLIKVEQYEFKILAEFDTYESMVEYERLQHIQKDVVVSCAYFNLSIAASNNFTKPGNATVYDNFKCEYVSIPSELIDGVRYVGTTKGCKHYNDGIKNITIHPDKSSTDLNAGRIGNFHGNTGYRHTTESLRKMSISISSTKQKQRQTDYAAFIEPYRRRSILYAGKSRNLTKTHRESLIENFKKYCYIININTLETMKITYDEYHESYKHNPNWMLKTTHSIINSDVIVKCNYCGLESRMTASFNKWHNNNCKYNKIDFNLMSDQDYYLYSKLEEVYKFIMYNTLEFRSTLARNKFMREMLNITTYSHELFTILLRDINNGITFFKTEKWQSEFKNEKNV